MKDLGEERGMQNYWLLGNKSAFPGLASSGEVHPA